ncbi:MAG TPA: roadblock/LC7 domain-containing protein, partial [Longimicrobium sp.]|nr:roadblock/LC7 domain-containing protein [Longimicrobium sp.]
MSELDQALDRIRSHPGVEHVLVLGRDGLLIQHTGGPGLDAETVSAMVPGVAGAAAALGGAAGLGPAATLVVRLERGVAVVQGLSDEVLLAVLLQGGTGF